VISDLPTHEDAGRQINYDREVKPTLLRTQICNVTHESGPWDAGSEITVNQILGILITFSLNRRDLKSPWLKGFQALGAHDFRYQTNTARVTQLVHFTGDPPAAIDFPIREKQVDHHGHEFLTAQNCH